ncbi:MAG TPA: hypothetical protein VMV47_17985 [Bacteroidales bacterium]|nr:hypothetical protein [Bacteroidales bacterium]
MKKQQLLLILILFLSVLNSYSQDFQIASPRLEFDGNKLLISYDMLNAKKSDQFYVWVEIEKKNGEALNANSLTGDIGDIKAGTNKMISWIPSNDSVFLNEVVNVELKAEKYMKSYNKGKMTLLSIVIPGLGQTKMSNGKPYWLTGIAAYGTLAGGLITHSNYLKSYDKYLTEEDPVKRSELFDQSQTQMNLSGALLVTSAAIWVTNLIWVGITPNRYQPLSHAKITLAPSNNPARGTNMLTLKVNF